MAISLLLAQCVASSPSKNAILTCSPLKNPFISNLLDHGVNLLVSPKKMDHCGKEWINFGTCCDYESLKKYQHSESERYLNSTQNFLQSLKDLISSSNQNSETVISKIKESKVNFDKHQNSTTNSSLPNNSTTNSSLPNNSTTNSSLPNNSTTNSSLPNNSTTNSSLPNNSTTNSSKQTPRQRLLQWRSQRQNDAAFNSRSNFQAAKKNSDKSSAVVNLGKKISSGSSAALNETELTDEDTGEALEELKNMFHDLIVLSDTMQKQVTGFETSQHRCSAKLSAYKTAALCST